jgi:hypothetical protein
MSSYEEPLLPMNKQTKNKNKNKKFILFLIISILPIIEIIIGFSTNNHEEKEYIPIEFPILLILKGCIGIFISILYITCKKILKYMIKFFILCEIILLLIGSIEFWKICKFHSDHPDINIFMWISLIGGYIIWFMKLRLC